MAHKIRIYDANTNEEVEHQDWYFIGTDNKIYHLCECNSLIKAEQDLYWKFDMIEVKE